jgi:hypothetical protein
MSKTDWLLLWREVRKSILPDLGYENKLWIALTMARTIRNGKYEKRN